MLLHFKPCTQAETQVEPLAKKELGLANKAPTQEEAGQGLSGVLASELNNVSPINHFYDNMQTRIANSS